MQRPGRFTAADPEDYGFGVKAMNRIKVCVHCGQTEPAGNYICSGCGEKLPQMTVFQLYRLQHRLCPICDTVLADYMRFCPHCGQKI